MRKQYSTWERIRFYLKLKLCTWPNDMLASYCCAQKQHFATLYYFYITGAFLILGMVDIFELTIVFVWNWISSQANTTLQMNWSHILKIRGKYLKLVCMSHLLSVILVTLSQAAQPIFVHFYYNIVCDCSHAMCVKVLWMVHLHYFYKCLIINLKSILTLLSFV